MSCGLWPSHLLMRKVRGVASVLEKDEPPSELPFALFVLRFVHGRPFLHPAGNLEQISLLLVAASLVSAPPLVIGEIERSRV